jgi:spore maturation protein CgeB
MKEQINSEKKTTLTLNKRTVVMLNENYMEMINGGGSVDCRTGDISGVNNGNTCIQKTANPADTACKTKANPAQRKTEPTC